MSVLEKIKKYAASRGVGYYLTLPALAFCIAALCLYVENGVTSFNPELNTAAIAYITFGIALCVICLAVDFLPIKIVVKPIKYVAYLLCLYAFMWFVYSQVTYIANVFVAIDGYTFTSGFIATMVMYALSFVFVLLAAVLNSWTPWIKKNKANSDGADGDEPTDAQPEEVNA